MLHVNTFALLVIMMYRKVLMDGRKQGLNICLIWGSHVTIMYKSAVKTHKKSLKGALKNSCTSCIYFDLASIKTLIDTRPSSGPYSGPASHHTIKTYQFYHGTPPNPNMNHPTLNALHNCN